MVGFPVLDVCSGAHNVEVSAHQDLGRLAPGRIWGVGSGRCTQVHNAVLDSLQIGHLFGLFRGIQGSGMQVGAD